MEGEWRWEKKEREGRRDGRVGLKVVWRKGTDAKGGVEHSKRTRGVETERCFPFTIIPRVPFPMSFKKGA